MKPETIGSSIFDPAFKGEPGVPPFGWSLSPGSAGLAEIRGGALEVYYYGRESVGFARQLLMLEAGSYRLSTRLKGEAAQPPSHLAWRLTCLQGGAPLLREKLADLAGASGGDMGSFSVPASGCDAQWLELIGIPPVSPKAEAASITSVALARANPS